MTVSRSSLKNIPNLCNKRRLRDASNTDQPVKSLTLYQAFSTDFKDIVRKRENAGASTFFFFTQCFSPSKPHSICQLKKLRSQID